MTECPGAIVAVPLAVVWLRCSGIALGLLAAGAGNTTWCADMLLAAATGMPSAAPVSPASQMPANHNEHLDRNRSEPGAGARSLRSCGANTSGLKLGAKDDPGRLPLTGKGKPTSEADSRVGPRRHNKENRLLRERLDRGGFVVLHVEHGVQLGDLQQVVNFLGQVEQLEFTALILHCGKGADQFADT